MSRLWIIIGSILTTVVLAVAGFGVLNVLAHETETETFTFGASGITSLEVDNDLGRVEIIAAETETITVVADVSHGLRRTAHSARTEGHSVVLESDCPLGPPIGAAPFGSVWCEVNYTVTIPSGVNVDVRNHNGKIAVTGMTGEIALRTSNGAIEVRELSGDLSLSTSNGPISADNISSARVEARTSNGPVELSFGNAPAAVDASTSNGPIEIVVPDDGQAYRIDLHTSLIGSSTTSIRTDPDSDRSISARTSNGPITVRYPA